jgi:hypothetical protein
MLLDKACWLLDKPPKKKCVPIRAPIAFVSVGVVSNVVSVTPTKSPQRAESAEGNRLLQHAAWINCRLDRLDQDSRARLEEMLEIDPNEATACLEGQARAAASDLLTSDEALTIYQSLTPEGWEPGTRLEVKMTIVGIMDRLLTPMARPATRWSHSAT